MPTSTKQKKTKTVPKLHFPGFEGEWSKRKLREVVKSHNSGIYKKSDEYGKGVNILGVSNLYDISSVRGQVFRKVPLSKEEVDQYSLEAGDLLYGESSLVREGIAKTLFVTKEGAGTAFAWHTRRYKVDHEKVIPQYVYYFLSSPYSRKYMMSVATQTALTGITTKDYFSAPLKFPSLPEQQKIASFLGAVDEWIENLRSERAAWERYKKGMMQKIFPSTSSGQVPEIRFKTDDGKSFPQWEEKKLGEVLDYEQPGKYIVQSTKYDEENGTPVLTAGKTFVLGYTDETDGIYPQSKLPVIIFDDFTTTKQFVDFPFKVKSSAMKILRNKDDNISDIRFVYAAIQKIRFALGEEHKRFWISEYSKVKIPFPSFSEQQKIAEFLTSLDKVIESKQNQITLAEQWKKGLMQGLFI